MPGSFAQEIIDQLKPVMYDTGSTNGITFYVGSLGDKLFQEIEDYASDSIDNKPGWSIVVDADRAPDKTLDWLAQFMGLVITSGLSPADRRLQVKALPNWRRGSRQAMIDAVKTQLTGIKTVIIRERSGGFAYRLLIKTLKSQTPVADWSTTNLVPNPSFEVNTTNWSPFNSTLTRITSDSIQGLASCKVVAATASDFRADSAAIVSGGPPIPRVPHGVSCWVKGEGTTVGKTFILQLNENGGASGSATVTSVSVVLTNQWQRVGNFGTPAQSDRTNLTVLARITASVAAGDVFYIDGVQLEINPGVTPYTDTSRAAGLGPVGLAIASQKPGGIILTYDAVTGQDYQQLLTNHPVYSNVFATYATYQGVVDDQAGA